MSQNALDKKAIEYIVVALPDAPASGLVSLRLDDCSLKPQALDALGNRISTILNAILTEGSACCTEVITAKHLTQI